MNDQTGDDHFDVIFVRLCYRVFQSLSVYVKCSIRKVRSRKMKVLMQDVWPHGPCSGALQQSQWTLEMKYDSLRSFLRTFSHVCENTSLYLLCVLPWGAVCVLLAHSRPVSKCSQRHSATPPVLSDPKQASATWSCNPANALMHADKETHTHTRIFIQNVCTIIMKSCTHILYISLLQSVLVELVQFVPVGIEEGGALLDPLALQRPSPRHHLLPAGQRSLHWASQLVDAHLHFLCVIVVVGRTYRDVYHTR